MKHLFPLLPFALAALLPAQKVPLPDDPARVLQLFDLRPLALVDPDGGRMPVEPTAFEAFLQDLVVPALGREDAVRALGPHHIAMLGSPEQIAWVERLLAAVRADREQVISVDIRLLDLGAAGYARILQPVLGPAEAPAGDGEPGGRRSALLEREQADALLKALPGARDCQTVQSPHLSVYALQLASLQVANEISYVRDFKIEREGGVAIVDPIVDTLLDGDRVEVIAAPVGKDRFAVRCTLLHSKVHQPLPTAEVTLGPGQPGTIQLPRVTTMRFQQSAVLPVGGAAVLAGRRADGRFLAAILSVRREPDPGK